MPEPIIPLQPVGVVPAQQDTKAAPPDSVEQSGEPKPVPIAMSGQRHASAQVQGAQVIAADGGFSVAVASTLAAPETSIPGGGVAGTRISPDCRVFILVGAHTLKNLAPSFVVELGSGHGMLGTWACAQLNPRSEEARELDPQGSSIPVVLTDIADFLYLATETKQLNPHLPLHVAPLHFGDKRMLEDVLDRPELQEHVGGEGRTCLLIGAGITYWECVFEPLAATLMQFLEGKANPNEHRVVLLAYFKRDWSVEKRFWTKLLKPLEVEVIHEMTLADEGEVDSAVHAPSCRRSEMDGLWNARLYKISAPRVAAQRPSNTSAAFADTEDFSKYSNKGRRHRKQK